MAKLFVNRWTLVHSKQIPSTLSSPSLSLPPLNENGMNWGAHENGMNWGAHFVHQGLPRTSWTF
eukprot:6540052-Pyramimonas_sp.AAC.1